MMIVVLQLAVNADFLLYKTCSCPLKNFYINIEVVFMLATSFCFLLEVFLLHEKNKINRLKTSTILI